MAELSFSQAERRSYLVPALVGLIILGLAGAGFYLFAPYRTAHLTVVRAAAVPVRTVYKGSELSTGDFKVVADQAQDDLYVLVTVRVQDDLKLPVFIKDLTGTITTANGAELDASAVQKPDLDAVYASFPAVKKASGAPLLRETEVQPGGVAEGVVLLHFAGPESVWSGRSAATLTVDTYHQGPLTVSIPK